MSVETPVVFDVLCAIADREGLRVEVHVAGRRLDRIRVSPPEPYAHQTRAHASIARHCAAGERGAINEAARICIEELARQQTGGTA